MTEPACSVSRETADRLALFLTEIRRWNSTINLVSPADLDALEQRHCDDCLQLVPLLPSEAGWSGIDMGSGAGFPGLVLAIASGHPFALIESDKRKAAFLREAARITGAPVTVHASRIGSAEIDPAGVVTARALAPLDKLLDWAAPKLKPDGVALFLKGRDVADELTHARRRWHMRVEEFPSRTRRDATILRIMELSPVAPTP